VGHEELWRERRRQMKIIRVPDMVGRVFSNTWGNSFIFMHIHYNCYVIIILSTIVGEGTSVVDGLEILPVQELHGVRGSVAVNALCYKLEAVGSRPDEVNEFFPIYLTLPAALGP
jgi:hypothetical protein